MNILTHIRNMYFLWRGYKNKQIDLKILLGKTQRNYKKKNSWIRNKVAQIIKERREYKIRDFSIAKNAYENTNPINIKPGDYITKFSRNEPVKGKRWCEYYINQGGAVGTYLVDKNLRLKTYKGETNHMTWFNEDTCRSFRFATEEEIRQYKANQDRYNRTMNRIKELQSEINDLYSSI